MTEAAFNLHSVVTAWIQALGVVVAVAVFIYTLVSRRRQRALERYEDITTRWIEFLRACREHPDLELGPLRSQSKDQDEVRKERIAAAAYLELLTLLERVYILKSQKLSPVELPPDVLQQMVQEYADRKAFVSVWKRARGWFDLHFVEFVDRIVSTHVGEGGKELTEDRSPHLTPGWSGRSETAAQP